MWRSVALLVMAGMLAGCGVASSSSAAPTVPVAAARKLSGINHVTFLTADLDRLAAFYEEVFGARKLVELPLPEPDGPGRHALIGVGAGAALHPFELSRVELPPARRMFERGRVDHFALDVPDAETFERARADLVARGASDGRVTDFGVVRVLSFSDPLQWRTRLDRPVLIGEWDGLSDDPNITALQSQLLTALARRGLSWARWQGGDQSLSGTLPDGLNPAGEQLKQILGESG
jgi:catechol 2,3-dioxygenase-like lactoylglutathione lyase family enzyme